MDDLAPWIFGGAAAAIFALLLGVSFLRAFRDGQTTRLARRLGLELDPTITPHVGRQVVLRTRLGALGGLLGCTSTLAVSGLVDVAASWLVVGSILTGVSLGISASALIGEPPAPADAIRVPRARDIGARDYVSPFELVPMRVLVVVAVVMSPVWLLPLGPVAGALVPVPITAALAVVAAIVFELGGRAILARPSRAQSAEQLVWDDALRATALRQLLTAPLTLALISVVGSGFALLSLMPATVGLVAVNVVTPLFVTALLVVAVLMTTSRPERYFLRRLWPERPSAAPSPSQPATVPESSGEDSR